MAKKITGKKPETMITDGLPAYHDTYKKSFGLCEIPEQNTFIISNSRVTTIITKWNA